MDLLIDIYGRNVRLSIERQNHIETDHPEMSGQIDKIKMMLRSPEIVVKSKIDRDVELFYRYYVKTPVKDKYLCVVVKTINRNSFIITAYFTDTIKKGEVLWKKK